MDQLNFAMVLAIGAGVVALLFVVITRGTRAVIGPRRRLEETVGLAVLEGRLKRGEICRDEFNDAARVVSSDTTRPGSQ